MLTKLTKKQEDLEIVFRDKYIDSFKSGKRPDKKAVKAWVDMMYSLINKKNPKIIYIKSPLWAQYLANILTNKKLQKQINTGSEVWSEVWSEVGSEKLKWFPFASYGNTTDYWWIAFYDYFESIGINIWKASEKFHIFRDMILGWVYDMIQFENYCIVVELPEYYHKKNKRLHSEKWPAIRFKDGYELYRLNWIKIKNNEEMENIVNDKYTVQELLAIANNDTRAIAYEYFNKEKFASESHKILDTQIDDQWNEMKIVEFTNKNIGRFYVGICPSTHKTHYIATKEDTCIRAKEVSFGLKNVEWINEY